MAKTAACDKCKTEVAEGEETHRIWSTAEKTYLRLCDKCYAKTVASYKKKILGFSKGLKKNG